MPVAIHHTLNRAAIENCAFLNPWDALLGTLFVAASPDRQNPKARVSTPLLIQSAKPIVGE